MSGSTAKYIKLSAVPFIILDIWTLNVVSVCKSLTGMAVSVHVVIAPPDMVGVSKCGASAPST